MGGTTVPPLSNIAEEHPTGERGMGATIASSSSGDGANQRESPPTADPTGNPSPTGSGADNLCYQVPPDEWMRPGPSTRPGKAPAGQAQPKSRATRPSVKQPSGTMEPLTQVRQEPAESPAGDPPPTQSTIEALLSAMTGIAQGMDDIRSEMTDVRQQLSDVQQTQAGLDRPSQQPEPELRPAESRP